METIGEIFSSFSELALVTGTMLAAVLFFFRSIFTGLGTALLAALGRGAGHGFGQRLSPGRDMAGRRLPTNPRQRLARQALFEAEARQARMESYVDAFSDLLALRGGPFAVSVTLCGLVEPGFAQKVTRLRQRVQEFDRLEGTAQRIVQRYESDYERRCEPTRDELRALSVQLARLKARHRRFAWQPWRRRWRHTKARLLATRRRILAAAWRLRQAELRLNMSYRTVLEPALAAADQYERAYLTHWVHSFEADLDSLRLTVVSGRLVELIGSAPYAGLRASLGLDGLRWEAGKLEPELRDFIAARGGGFGPEATTESLFETYLRLRLLEDDALRRVWGIDRVWLERDLPPPGALGLVHERYQHLAIVGSLRAPDSIAEE